MKSEKSTASGWFTLTSGFKVHGRCPECFSPRISFHRERKPGLKGISSLSKGLIPVCIDCGESLPLYNDTKKFASNKKSHLQNEFI